MTKPFRALLLFAGLTAPLVTGCTGDSDESDPVTDPDELDQADGLGDELAATACTVSGTNINRSMVVTTPEVLAKFSFKRVIDRLRSTAGVAGVQSSTILF